MSNFELILRMSENGIQCNSQQLKEQLPSLLVPYNYIVDDSNVDKAKEDRKKLNALENTISTKRKEFEELAFGVWKKEKANLMEMEKMIKKSSEDLSSGIKDLEEKEKLQKMEEVRECYLAILPNLPLKVDFGNIYIRKDYDKKIMTVKKIKEDVQLKVNKIIEDWDMMQIFITDLTDIEIEQVKECYCENFVLGGLGHAKALSDKLHSLREKVLPSGHKQVSQHLNEVKKEETITENKDILVRGFVYKGEQQFFEELMLLAKKHNATLLKVVKSEGAIERWMEEQY